MLTEGNIVNTYIGLVVGVPGPGWVTQKAKKHMLYVCVYVCGAGGVSEENCNILWVVFYWKITYIKKSIFLKYMGWPIFTICYAHLTSAQSKKQTSPKPQEPLLQCLLITVPWKAALTWLLHHRLALLLWTLLRCSHRGCTSCSWLLSAALCL